MQGAINNIGKERNLILMVAAFAAVYLVWGSTYLAIKYAIETFPPFLMAGGRFVVAGAILYTWARFSSDYEKPKREHWRTSLVVGTFLLLGGNGAVVFAQHYISSSLAALLVATEPFFIVLLTWLWLKGGRPTPRVIIGLAVGFVGVWLLIAGQKSTGSSTSGSEQLLGTFAIIGGALAWAIGSIYGLRAPVPKSSILTAGMQMLAGGFVLLLVSLITGEWRSFEIAQVSANSWLAVVYLIIFGSLIGFTAYSWLLKNAQPAMVSTYAYVNPMVAVLLGWLVAGETMTGQMLVGAGVVVGSVVLITLKEKSKGDPTENNDFGTSSETAGGTRPVSASA